MDLSKLSDAELQLLAKAQGSGLSSLNDAELMAMQELSKKHSSKPQYAPPPTEPSARSMTDDLLSLAGRALDYTGGLVRTGIGTGIAAGRGAYEAATGAEPKQVIKEEDLMRALTGNAPSTAEYMERADVPEMGSVELPLVGKVTGRGVVGGATDIASGVGASKVLRTLSKGQGLLAKTAKVVSTPERLLEKGVSAAGKKLYRSGFKAADRAAELAGKGKNAVSNVLMKHGIWGGTRSVQEQAQALVEKLSKQADDAIQAANASGATISMKDALGPTRAEAVALMNQKGTAEFKAGVQKFLNQVDDLIAQENEVVTKFDYQVPKMSAVEGTPTRLGPLEDIKLSGASDIVQKEGKIYRKVFEPSIQSEILVEVPADEAASMVSKVPSSFIEGTPATTQRTGMETITGSRVSREATPYTVSEANQVKQQIYGMLNDPAYSIIAKQPVGKQLLKRGVRGIKESIEQKAPSVKEINADLGALLSARKKMIQEVTKSEGKNALTQVKGGLLVANPAAAAGMYTAQGLTSAPVRSGAGLLMSTKAEPIADVLKALAAKKIDKTPDPLDKLKKVVRKYKDGTKK